MRTRRTVVWSRQLMWRVEALGAEAPEQGPGGVCPTFLPSFFLGPQDFKRDLSRPVFILPHPILPATSTSCWTQKE